VTENGRSLQFVWKPSVGVSVRWSALMCFISCVQSWSKDGTQSVKWSTGLRIQITLFRCLRHTQVWAGSEEPFSTSSQNCFYWVHGDQVPPAYGISICFHFLSLCHNARCKNRVRSLHTPKCMRGVCVTNRTWRIGKSTIPVIPSKEPQVVNVNLLNKILTQQEVTKHLLILWSGFCSSWARIMLKIWLPEIVVLLSICKNCSWYWHEGAPSCFSSTFFEVLNYITVKSGSYLYGHKKICDEAAMRSGQSTYTPPHVSMCAWKHLWACVSIWVHVLGLLVHWCAYACICAHLSSFSKPILGSTSLQMNRHLQHCNTES